MTNLLRKPNGINMILLLLALMFTNTAQSNDGRLKYGGCLIDLEGLEK